MVGCGPVLTNMVGVGWMGCVHFIMKDDFTYAICNYRVPCPCDKRPARMCL